MSAQTLSIPPAEVPLGLSEIDYVKLTIRYALIPRWRLYLTAQKLALEASGREGSLTDDQRQRFATALGVLSAAMEAQEMMTSAKGWVLGRLQDTAALAHSRLDDIPSIKQPKAVLTGLLSDLSKRAVSGLDSVVENLVLPSLGLPLNGIARARSARDYYWLGRKYLIAGLHNHAAICFQNCIDADATSKEARLSAMCLRTEIPLRRPSRDAERKSMRIKELLLIKKNEAAIVACREAVREFDDQAQFYFYLADLILPEGDVEEASCLIDSALRLFPEYALALLLRAKIDMVGLRLLSARKTCERLQALRPDYAKTASEYQKMIQILETY